MKILAVSDDLIIGLNTHPANPDKGYDNRSVLKDYLGKCFFVRGTATAEIKIVGHRKMRLFTDTTATILTTTGAIEQLIKFKTYTFDHLWIESETTLVPGEAYTCIVIASEYERMDGTVGCGFNKPDYYNPAELFDVNLRLALGLLRLQLRLQHIPSFRLDTHSLTLYLRGTMEALVSSENRLESLYQTKKLEECRPTRSVLALLGLWLEVLEKPVIVKKTKKAKTKGFAACNKIN